MRRPIASIAAVLLLGLGSAAGALVHYDEGRLEIAGVALLRDAESPTTFYYLPPAPRLAAADDGGLQLLCLKYVDRQGGTHGGLFHALVELTLPAAEVAALEGELRERVAGARIAGPVPLLEAEEDGPGGAGASFRLVSGVLSDSGEGGFTRAVVTSERAPITPGSRAAVAAILDQRGATLLWESLAGATSDVSVAISASYEARVRSYGARVTAEVETLYRHFSEVTNRQQEFSRRQIRRSVDELVQSQGLQIEVFERELGGGGDLDGLLELVTEKLTELLFDHQAGWARAPEQETTVEAGQIRGRQSRGFLARLFAGSGDSKYYSDDQWVLKDRRDVRRHRFVLDLRRETTVRVPVETAGNLGGLYAELAGDPRYFRVVPLEDPAFQRREVHFQLDGSYFEAFGHTLAFVTLELRKRYPDHPPFNGSLAFGPEEVAAGITVQSLSFPRLGAAEADWTEYEYRVSWGLRGGGVLREPADGGGWRRASDPVVLLAPPLERHEIEIDAERFRFELEGVRSAVVEVASFLGGEPGFRHRVVLRDDDAEPVASTVVFCDRGRPLAYRVTWRGPEGSRSEALTPVDSPYLYLVPPADRPEASP